MQPIHGPYRDQQRYDENYRDSEEAHNEPRAQGHFRGAMIGIGLVSPSCKSSAVARITPSRGTNALHAHVAYLDLPSRPVLRTRSEERRVGKECISRK